MNMGTVNTILLGALSVFTITLPLTMTVIGVNYIAGAVEPPLKGHYTCSGTQGGQTYTMKLFITDLGKTYELAWRSDDTDPGNMFGLGLLEDDKLAVALVVTDPASRAIRGVGAVLYTVKSERLDAVWTRGDGEIDTEVCTADVNGRPA